MRQVSAYLMIFTSAMLFSCATTTKTSEIPDRREFPVNTEINPCNDFFQYACSKAIDGFQLREDRNRHIFSFSDSHERILAAKKEYLGGLSSKTKLNEKSQQLKDYFVSCTNQSARAAEEKALLDKKTKEVMAIKSKKALAQYLTNNATQAKFSHVGFGNIENLDNSKIYDWIILPNKMTTMPVKSYYANKELMKEFESIVTDFFKLVGDKAPAKRAAAVVAFESDFIKNYPTPAEKRPMWSKRAYSSKKHLLNYKNLQLSALLKKVPSKTKIRNPMDKVFKYVNGKFASTSLDDLKAVVLYQMLSGKLDEGFPKYFDRKFAFSNKFLGGSPIRPSLAERCTTSTMGSFGKEIDHEVFDVIFPNFPTEKFVSLLEKVRASIIDGLKKNKWLSKKSKANAIKKIKMAKFQVVKPKNDREWDFNPVAKYDPKGYLANSQLLAKNLQDREFKRLKKPVDKTIWYYGPLTVNAYYDPSANKFVMLAGILQYPFYDPNLPEWVNMGAVGAVVGHELGHGVDDQGAKYDEVGRVRQWMSNKDVKKFQARGARLVKQFNEAGHDGKLTLGENIGDLVGVTFALDAAKKIMPVDPAGRDRATKDFFLQYARAWCGVMRPKQVEMRLKTDPHALIWARVNEQMKHQGEFARVYQCKAGDKLFLPEKERVSIW